MTRITMASPHFTAADRERIHAEVDRILDGALSMGPNVRAFEEEFAALTGVRHAVAMNSCTATLETALLGLGVSVGAEVIVPAETFIATGMAVHLVGGTPVFAEICPSSFCLDLDDVARRITPRTKGVILVHMGGMIAPDVAAFRSLCDARGLFLIEDAAHAPGARRDGRAAGAFGHAGCFSFYPTKVMTSGEGGMLTTDDAALASFARSQQRRGQDMAVATERYAAAGRNVRMTELTALIGRVQLSHLGEFLRERHRVATIYRQELAQESRVTVILPDDLSASSCWKIPTLLAPGTDRALLTERLAAHGVTVDWAYQPALHLQPVFQTLLGTRPGMLPVSEDLLSRHVCLPCHPLISDAEAVHVARSLSAVLDSLGDA